MSARARAPRGYTVVELLMALTVFAIGVAGIIAMQKVTVSANRNAKNFAIATHIAQAWQEQLALDASVWNYPSPSAPALSDIADTAWLNRAGTAGGASSGWFLPAYSANRLFGGGFDALGRPVANYADAAFCTHLRLTWLAPDGVTVAATNGVASGNGLIRVEIRVFWLMNPNDQPVTTAGLCPAAQINDNTWANQVGAAVDRYAFVYQATAVRQNQER